MDGLRTRALLRVRADGEHLLTFRAAAVVDLLRRANVTIAAPGLLRRASPNRFARARGQSRRLARARLRPRAPTRIAQVPACRADLLRARCPLRLWERRGAPTAR